MSKTVLLQDDFSLGSSQDTPITQLPKGKVYQCTDFIPELDGIPLAKRGGWARSWNTLSSASYAAGVQIAPFAAGTKLVAFDDDGDLHYNTSFDTPTWTTLANTVVPAHPPTFWKDRLIVFDVNGTAGGYAFDGSGGVSLGGGAPTASMSCVYKNHLVAARSSANTRRIWFSSADDYTLWDTAADGQWFDADMPVQGLAAMRNMILVFGEGKTQRVRGDIIPGVVGSDMVVEPMFTIGCSDPASIATSDDYVVFANSSAIYLTDGVGIIDVTEQAGMSTYWRTQMLGYSSSWTIAATLFRGWYIFSVMNGSSYQFSGMIDVKRRRYVEMTNIKATMMTSSPPGILDINPKLVWSERGSANLAQGTGMWSPTNINTTDGDGTAVTPVLKTGVFYGRPGLKRWKHLYVTYKLSDSASDNPVITAGYNVNPWNLGYRSISPTLTENTQPLRVRVPISYATEGVSIQLSQTNASSTTNIYKLEADAYAEEPGRLWVP